MKLGYQVQHRTQQWNFGFYKRWGIWLAERLLASQEGLCSMVWVELVEQIMERPFNARDCCCIHWSWISFQYGTQHFDLTGKKKLHNEELRNLYWSDIISALRSLSRVIVWRRHARIGEMRSACKILVGKPEGKSPLVRQRCRWEDIRMDHRKIRWERVDYIHLAWESTSGGLFWIR
jgi:hypothetical protein